MAFLPPSPITPFPLWTEFTPTLPNLYWDVDSHEERIKRICLELKKLLGYVDYLGDNVNLDHKTIEELQRAFQSFIDGHYDEYYEKVISDWVKENMPEIIGQAVHMVFFGLTEDGYFCAYIPEEWAFVFDTDMDYSSDTYGHIIIDY